MTSPPTRQFGQLPKKSDLFARRLWLSRRYRRLSAQQLAELSNLSLIEVQKLECDVGRSDVHQRRQTDGFIEKFKNIAPVLFVDQEWLMGNAPADRQPIQSDWLVYVESTYQRSEAGKAKHPSRLWSDLEAAWCDLLEDQKSAHIQRRLKAMITKGEANGRPWPLYHRSDLLATSNPGTAFGYLTPRPVSSFFTLDQVAQIGPILLPSEPAETWSSLPPHFAPPTPIPVAEGASARAARVLNTFMALPGRQPPPEITPAHAQELCDLFALKPSRISFHSVLAAARQWLQSSAPSGVPTPPDAQLPKGIPDVERLLSVAYRSQLPGDRPLTLPDLLTTYRAWRGVMGDLFRPPPPRDLHGDPVHRYAGVILPYEDAMKLIQSAINRGSIRGPVEKAVGRLLSQGRMIKLEREVVKEKKKMMQEVKDKNGSTYLLIPDVDDRRRWLSNRRRPLAVKKRG